MSAPISSTSSNSGDCNQVKRIRKFAWFYTSAWSLLLLGSAVLNHNGNSAMLNNLALSEARTAINRDFLYRHWASSFGGVYAPVTENNPPNPFLSHLPERDITTPSGRKLTLVNPSYMNRQVYELGKESFEFVAIGHLTSLKPIRYENAADPWEKKALDLFEKGTREKSELIQINNEPYIRLMQALETEKSCLKCHAAQGYKVGDVRGGLSIMMPIKQLVNASQAQLVGNMSTHGLIWFFGIIVNFLVARQLTRNVSAQNLVEAELQESNTNLKAIFDVSPLPILISTYNNGIVRETNLTFSTVFGYRRDEIIGRTSLDLGIWSDISERHIFIRAIDEQPGTTSFPAEIKNAVGEVRTVWMYSTRIDYKDEQCLLIVFMDVTDQKRAENDLRQAQKMDVVGQLAGGVAHDFNNMLTAIIGSAEMMERHVQENPVPAKLLKNIQEAAVRSAELTAQLLSFSHKGNIMNVQVRINKTVQSVIALLEHSIDKSIQLETKLTAENDLVIGDPTQLQNALLNLGINSRDAMPQGGTITFATASVLLDPQYCNSHSFQLQPGRYVEISVVDTGTGISDKIREHIFEPFFTTKEIGKGTGLGLAAVYSTVTEHRGSVSVQSEPGMGTIFKLYLPLAEKEHITITAEQQPSNSRPAGILLVDDESLIREMGRMLLEEQGFKVYLAEDGQQALELYELEREHISLVILDVVMPVMGGKEALQRLTATYPDIKVLISSGFHHCENNDTFIKLGAIGFIKKPYHSQELYKAVDDALNNIS